MNPLKNVTSTVARHSSSLVAECPAVNFEEVHRSFANISSVDLLRSYCIMTGCSMPMIVKHSHALVEMGKNLGGKHFFSLIKSTLFKHFAAGETAEGCQPILQKLKGAGVGGIVNFSAEADVGSAGNIEQACVVNMKAFEDSIRVASLTGAGFAAVKVTAICPVTLLQRLTTVLNSVQTAFMSFADISASVNSHDMYEGLRRLGVVITPEEFQSHFEAMDTSRSGSVSFVEWAAYLDPAKGKLPLPFSEPLTAEELSQLRKIKTRLDSLGQLASDCQIHLIVDAEQTFFQPAIDYMAMEMQKKYNGDRVVVFNTIQNYLKDAPTKLKIQAQFAQKHGFKFGPKLVRGAYLVQERRLAKEQGYTDPIWSTVDDTHNCFNENTVSLLKEVANDTAELFVASHNEKSILLATQGMNSLRLPAKGGGVYFGQLLGMSDHITYALGMNGFEAYKVLPYGPVHEVMPYLLRRAHENCDVFSTVSRQRQLIGSELRRRFMHM